MSKRRMLNWLLSGIFLLLLGGPVSAQNPLIRNQFTADPSARVFEDRIYVYPSHDIHWGPGKGRPNWFCMEDYHVFSSANGTDWHDHGVIVSQDRVKWADSAAYSMWAPDCIFRDGQYYFYFPTRAKDTVYGKGFAIGVAVGDRPGGPFIPLDTPISGVHGIDPNVFIDDDGQAYLYWAQGDIFGARLKDNMVELASKPEVLGVLPSKGLKEGPWLFQRKGIYYLTYPHVQNKTERLEYAMGNSPLGPFRYAGVIMDESPTGCWTNHQSILQFKGQWFLFYHHNDYSPDFDKNRSIRADSLFFNGDGTIQRVIPSLRGIGLTRAWDSIQVDRYSHISGPDVSIAFLDTLNPFKGWKLVLGGDRAWAQYNSVDFGTKKLKSLLVRAASGGGGILEVHADAPDGPILGKVKIPAGTGWKVFEVSLEWSSPQVHDLFLKSKGSPQVEVDWISFK